MAGKFEKQNIVIASETATIPAPLEGDWASICGTT